MSANADMLFLDFVGCALCTGSRDLRSLRARGAPFEVASQVPHSVREEQEHQGPCSTRLDAAQGAAGIPRDNERLEDASPRHEVVRRGGGKLDRLARFQCMQKQEEKDMFASNRQC